MEKAAKWLKENKEAILGFAKAIMDFAGDVGSAIGTIVRILVEYKTAVLAAGAAMAMYFAGPAIVSIIASITALATSISLLPTVLGLAGLAVKGFLTSFGGWAVAIGAAVALALELKNALSGLGDAYDQEMGAISRAADQNKNMRDRFEELAVVAGLTRDQIRELHDKFRNVEDAGMKYVLMLRQLKKEHPEVTEKIKAQEEAAKKLAALAQAEEAKKHAAEERKRAAALAASAAATEARKKAVEDAKKAEKEAAEWTVKFGSATGGLTDAGRELAMQLLQIGGYLPEFTAETQKAAEEQEALAKRIRELITAEGELTPVGEGVYIAMLQWAGLIPEVTDAVDDNGKATKKWSIDWKDANEVLQFAQSMVGGVTDLLGAMGIELGESGDAALQAASGIGQLWAGIQSGNPLAIIQGITQAVTGLLKLFKGDGVGEAIERENKWMQLTKDQVKQIKDLEKQYGSTHAATSDLLDQFIANADITTRSFDQWADRVHGILSDLDQGKMTMAQTQKQLGDAFTSLIAKAKELGTEGSASLISMFEDLAARGIKVAEVQEYIAEQLGAGFEGYKKMKSAIAESAAAQEAFGSLNITVFEEMLAYERKVSENQALVDSIKGAEAALVGLSNAQRLTEDQFDQFSISAVTAYDKLIAGGMDGGQALKTMGPYLQRLQMLHEQYGYTVDDATQKLLDEAIAAGTVTENQKTEGQKMLDVLERIATALGAGAEAMGKMGDAAVTAFRGATDEAHRLNAELDGLSAGRNISISTKAQGDYVSAAVGYYSPRLSQDTVFQAHKGEEVSIVPAGQNKAQGGGARNLDVKIYVQGEASPYQVARAINVAIDGNIDGVRSHLEEIK